MLFTYSLFKDFHFISSIFTQAIIRTNYLQASMSQEPSSPPMTAEEKERLEFKMELEAACRIVEKFLPERMNELDALQLLDAFVMSRTSLNIPNSSYLSSKIPIDNLNPSL